MTSPKQKFVPHLNPSISSWPEKVTECSLVTFRDPTTGFPTKASGERLQKIYTDDVLPTYVWKALLIGRLGREICFNQSEALTRCG